MKNERFKQICHFFAGLVLLPLAFKLFETKKFSLSVVMLLGAILFLFAAGMLDWLEKRLGNTSKLFYFIECIFLSFGSFVYYSKLHKKMPTLAYAGIGIVYFFLFLYFLYDKDITKKKRKKHRRHHKHHSSSSSEKIQPDIAS